MNYFLIAIFSIIILVNLNVVYGLTASEFVAKYGNELSKGEKAMVLVKVKGEPESLDSVKRAKEIRYLQSAILKFIHFAGATNVKSDTWNNEFTASVTTSLAKVLEKRSDIISVTIIENNNEIDNKDCSTFEPGADLSGCDLYAINLRNEDLRFVNLSNTNLKGADLQGADLSGADLRYAFLKYALLNGANFTDVNLSYSKLIQAEVNHADLTNANFYGATLYRSDFTSSIMKHVNFGYSTLTHANLSFVDLEGANMEGAGTWGTNLNHCYNHPICD